MKSIDIEAWIKRTQELLDQLDTAVYENWITPLELDSIRLRIGPAMAEASLTMRQKDQEEINAH